MATRYPTIKVQDYCFSPKHVVDNNKDIFVPCGKCDGCLLHKANEWSQRVGTELEFSPNSIFFTLTYSNNYLPTLVKYSPDIIDEIDVFPFWYSNHINSFRFDGKNIVRRFDNILFRDYGYKYIPVTHSDKKCINYMSKRDVQLWLKNLRSDLIKTFNYGRESTKDGLFRYYIISEIGPTTLRSHAHGIIFCKSHEISEYLLDCGLFKNWQMCDKSRFDDYAHYCDSGARGYVTQYLTCHSDLPKVYQQNKDIRPFRLASKAPSIGYCHYDKEEICENLSVGINEYSRTISRLGMSPVLVYSKDYVTQLFPKCFQFSRYSFDRILALYGCIWREVMQFRQRPLDVVERFRAQLHPMDFTAAYKCYRYCIQNSCRPFHYCFLLDEYYYLKGMASLKAFYEFQEKFPVLEEPYYLILLYINFNSVVQNGFNDFSQFGSSAYYHRVLQYFLEGFGLSVDYSALLDKEFYKFNPKRLSDYTKEVRGIIEGMTKTSKLNELLGIAPTCFT